jgi:hypothetical protein
LSAGCGSAPAHSSESGDSGDSGEESSTREFRELLFIFEFFDPFFELLYAIGLILILGRHIRQYTNKA